MNPFMSMFNDISCGSRDKKECESNANLVSLHAKNSDQDNGHFMGLGSEKKWYTISEDSPDGEWENMAERMMLEFAESEHPIFRDTSPEVGSRAKVMKKCRYAMVPNWKQWILFFE